MRTAALFSVCLLAVSAAAGAQPVRLESPDPLSRPAPDVELALSPALDPAPADTKLVPSLRAKAISEPAGTLLQVIVTLREPAFEAAAVGEADRLERIAALEHAFVRRAPASFRPSRGLSHFAIVSGEIPAGDLLELASLPEVGAVEEVQEYRAFRSEGGALIKSGQLRSQFGGDGKGVGIAIVDSGVDDAHPELGGRVVAQYDATDTTGDGTVDQNGHGTAVAGIAAGASGGAAPKATIWAVKVLDAEAKGNTEWTLDALNQIYAARTQFGGVHVVNMSLGSPESHSADCDLLSPAYAQVLQSLSSAGIAVLVAAGNDGFADGVAHPACHSKVISVGAVYDANIGAATFTNCSDATTAADRVTCYSNSGAPLDILAPSHCARTPQPGGGYATCFGGTSAASPYAAGVAAQILSLLPGTSPAQLQSAFMSTGKPITDHFTGLVRNRVDAVAAYQKLAGSSSGPCVASATAMCLSGGRFKVEATFETPAGQVGQAQVVKLTDDSGYLWFFNNANIEAVIKVLNACGLNSRFWVFAGGLTNVRTVITLTDSQTGTQKTYINPQSTAFQPIQDTSAFATCP